MPYDAEGQYYDGGGNYISPAIGSPSPSSLDNNSGGGGLLSSLGGAVQGISNMGLQWFTAVTKGVSTKLNVPQPVQATPGAATASLVNQVSSYIPMIILALAVVLIIKFIFPGK